MNIQPYINDCIEAKNHLEELQIEWSIRTGSDKDHYKRLIETQKRYQEGTLERFAEACEIKGQELYLEIHNQVINSLFN